MQEQTRQSRPRQLLIKLAVAIAIIKRDGVPCKLRMYADLVGTAGNRAAAHQRGKLIALFNLKPRLRRFPFLADADNTLAALQNVLQQRRLHHFYMGLPLAANQRQIVFLHPFFTQLFMQGTERRALFRHQQYA